MAVKLVISAKIVLKEQVSGWLWRMWQYIESTEMRVALMKEWA